MKYLPRKPSRLIRLSLKDLQERENDPRYRISMGDWHNPGMWGGTCAVCLAGSTMARLGVEPNRRCDPDDLGPDNRAKLYAINGFRCGNIAGALEDLNLKRPKGFPHRVKIPNYYVDRTGFFKKLNRLADRLEAVGL